MNFNSTYGIAAIVAGSIAIATTMTSENNQIVESNLEGCHKNLASLCIDTTSGNKDVCAAGATDRCEDARPKVKPA